VLRQPRDDAGRGPFVGGYVLGCPACEGDAGFECVEGEAAFVVGGCAGEGEEGGGDEAACCLGGCQCVGCVERWEYVRFLLLRLFLCGL
jgi:hypothetical protein